MTSAGGGRCRSGVASSLRATCSRFVSPGTLSLRWRVRLIENSFFGQSGPWKQNVFCCVQMIRTLLHRIDRQVSTHYAFKSRQNSRKAKSAFFGAISVTPRRSVSFIIDDGSLILHFHFEGERKSNDFPRRSETLSFNVCDGQGPGTGDGGV